MDYLEICLVSVAVIAVGIFMVRKPELCWKLQHSLDTEGRAVQALSGDRKSAGDGHDHHPCGGDSGLCHLLILEAAGLG